MNQIEQDIQLKRISRVKENLKHFKERNSFKTVEEYYTFDKNGFPICFVNVKEGGYSGIIYFILDDYARNNILYYKININDYIELIDILNDDDTINRGIGTEAIKLLCEIAKENGINKIKGFLSFVDQDHHDRQVHFYKKNGFFIDENDRFEKIIDS